MSTLLDGYVNRRELAAELRCSERTIIRYEREPDGLPSTLLGGRVLYKLDNVRAWLERRERRPNPTRSRRAA